MAVNTGTVETFDVTTIREDLQEALVSISPYDRPFMSAVGEKDVSNVLFEWPVTELSAVNSSNRVAEGEASPGNDAAMLPARAQNYVQLSDMVVETSSTSEAVNGASNAQTMAEQITLMLRRLGKDMESMLVGNTAASAGSSGTARATAGLEAFIRTNTSKGTSGGDPTVSGSGNAGYPNAGRTDGTLRNLTETMFNSVIKDCWDNGADPSIVMVGSSIKQKISSTFTGNATRYKDADDARLQGAIDVIATDFGEISLVPNRLQRGRTAFVLDPDYARVCYLQQTSQVDLAKTGHSDRKLISVEYGLQVDAEKAHGVIADIQ